MKLNTTELAALISGALLMTPVMADGERRATLQGPGGGSPGAEAWYMQTVVVVEDGESIVFDDRSGVFGRIPGASELRDSHDVPAFASVANSGGAVVFVKSEAAWGEDAGQYLSDYKPAGSDKQTWTFTVASNRPSAEVTLFWESFQVITQDSNGGWLTHEDNDNPTVAQLSLIDLATGERVPASNKKGKMKTYSFNMAGDSERHFRWVQGKVGRDDRMLGDLPGISERGVSGSSGMTSAADSASAAKSKDAPGLADTPPAIRRQ